MISAENNADLLNGGEIINLLEKYLCSCHSKHDQDSLQNEKKNLKKETVFPNLAGFCRFIGVGTSELESYGKSNPSEYERVLTVLEDEALNSGVSPALVSAYLKKRLGYDGARPQESSSQLEIKFEHDIFEDGG